MDNQHLSKFKKFSNIDSIAQFKDMDFIDKCVQKWIEDTDNVYYEFLTKNGYKIDKPYNIEQLNQIKENLEKQDKFIDKIEWIENETDNNNYTLTGHIIPFFNSISHPLSEEIRNKVIEKWKEKNRKDK